VSFIEPESELINIAAKMLWAGMMINTMQSAFENRKNAFNPICSDIVANEFPRFMIDRFMLESQHIEAIICASLIRINRRTSFHSPNDCSLNRSLIIAGDGLGDDTAPALAH